MRDDKTLSSVRDSMLSFANRTGLTDRAVKPRRYLWTDAHAVCNFLSLYGATDDGDYLDLALSLIDQVHFVLGRHRDDDPRDGWISGLDEAEGRDHPTAGGLRIGKALAERRRQDAFDERLEWERDGQYFHYLTKWIHALCRAADVTGDERYGAWAAELASAAYAGFITAGPQGKRLYWKMSIDLGYPLVPSSGHHDPLDGFISVCEARQASGASLDEEMTGLGRMLAGRHWTTTDPLGIGGLLFDANRVIGMTAAGGMNEAGLADTLVAASTDSLAAYVRDPSLGLPAEYRLGFRELGLSIGLRGVDPMSAVVDEHPESFRPDTARLLGVLGRYLPLADEIEKFWREPSHQRVQSWLDHEDINTVMLATSLLPDQFLAT